MDGARSREVLSYCPTSGELITPAVEPAVLRRGQPISRASVNGRTVQPRAASFTARQMRDDIEVSDTRAKLRVLRSVQAVIPWVHHVRVRIPFYVECYVTTVVGCPKVTSQASVHRSVSRLQGKGLGTVNIVHMHSTRRGPSDAIDTQGSTR